MNRSLMAYHPRVGFTFIPHLKVRVPHENGGYLVRVNGAGFRCNHEVTAQKRTQYRALLFGDSFTAGDGVSNGERYGDFLEQAIPNLEVLNFGLSATGPDQHWLAFQEFAQGVEHDLVIIAVMVENILRTAARYRVFMDGQGAEVIYAKPYFEMADGDLVLGGVPPQKHSIEKANLPPEELSRLDSGIRFPKIRKIAKKLGIRDTLQKITHFDPVPHYKDPQNPKWLLLRTILERWIQQNSKPVLLMPIPLFPYVEGTSDPQHYQKRYQELARDTHSLFHDPLPDLRKYSAEERRGFRFEQDPHLTPHGHRAIAKSLEPVLMKFFGSNA